jgi:hypothetical protein
VEYKHNDNGMGDDAGKLFFLKICDIFTNPIICDNSKKYTIKIYQKIIHPGLDTIALGA